MFDNLSKFNKAIVVGPGRSGTRILAKIIAKEIGFLYVDEGWFASSDETRFWKIFTSSKKMVVQAPNMIFLANQLGKRDDWAVVLSRRNINDITESEKHLMNMGISKASFQIWWQQSLGKYWKKDGILSEIVYDFWDKEQKFKIKNCFEVEYESLKDHPMFIKKEDRRKNFRHAEQTELGEMNNDGVFFQNDDRVKYRWMSDYTGEKVLL